MSEMGGSLGQVAFGHRFLGGIQRVIRGWCYVSVEELSDVRFGLSAGETVHGLTALDQIDGRHRTDPKGHRDLAMDVDVDLDQLKASGIFGRQLFENRCQSLAGFALWGPTIGGAQAPRGCAEQPSAGSYPGCLQ